MQHVAKVRYFLYSLNLKIKKLFSFLSLKLWLLIFFSQMYKILEKYITIYEFFIKENILQFQQKT